MNKSYSLRLLWSFFFGGRNVFLIIKTFIKITIKIEKKVHRSKCLKIEFLN